MADQPPQAAAQPPRPPAPVPLGSAGASSDPRVHQALAGRGTAVLNGDKAAVKAADDELAALGVSVGQ